MPLYRAAIATGEDAMRREVVVKSNGGIGLLGILGIVFVVLKLTGHIDWSWWWVTLPFWGPFALLLVGFIIFSAIHILLGGRR
jgi:hypothetical protein